MAVAWKQTDPAAESRETWTSRRVIGLAARAREREYGTWPGSTVAAARRRASPSQRSVPSILRDFEIPELGSARLRMGVDVVDIRRMRESLHRFGERFVQRLFSADEIAYASSGESQDAQRLAARFAAKEAAIKALDLGEIGINWRDIEVRKLPGGACRLALHGRAAVRARQLGVCEIALSLSHDGDYASAVVTALVAPANAASDRSRVTAS
jgi:holo-[acyl-carrier protein] synthase